VQPPAPPTTYTQGGWDSGGGRALLEQHFLTVYSSCPNSGYAQCVLIGSPAQRSAIFTSAAAIRAYLSAGGTAKVLTQSYVNPKSTTAGVIGGELLTLRLNVDFSAGGFTWTGLAGMKVAPGNPLAGRTVAEVLAIANTAVGGNGLPSGITMSTLSKVLSRINQNFVDGVEDNAYLVP
jgi:hypothetical protein